MVHNWAGRAHVETLRAWPELDRLARVAESLRDVLAGGVLIGSFARGSGDNLSDIDFIAVAHPGHWHAAWEVRRRLSAGALVTFDRFEEGAVGVAGHSWLTDYLVKVECLVAEPGAMRIAGDAVVVVGDASLLDGFSRAQPFTREAIKQYASELRETQALEPVEQAYDDLVALLRQDVLPRSQSPLR